MRVRVDIMVLLIENRSLRENYLPKQYGYGLFSPIMQTDLATPPIPSASTWVYTTTCVQLWTYHIHRVTWLSDSSDCWTLGLLGLLDSWDSWDSWTVGTLGNLWVTEEVANEYYVYIVKRLNFKSRMLLCMRRECHVKKIRILFLCRFSAS